MIDESVDQVARAGLCKITLSSYITTKMASTQNARDDGSACCSTLFRGFSPFREFPHCFVWQDNKDSPRGSPNRASVVLKGKVDVVDKGSISTEAGARKGRQTVLSMHIIGRAYLLFPA